MEVATQAHLDSVRLKLVQLIDSLTTLQSALWAASQSTSEPSSANAGVPSWPELLSRYNILLSHVVGLGGVMSGLGEGPSAGRDVRRERWEASTVVPAVEVDEGTDYVVGMLLRTKQVSRLDREPQWTVVRVERG